MRAQEFTVEARVNPDFVRADFGAGEDDDDITMNQLVEIADVIRNACGPYIENNRELLRGGECLYRGVKGANRLTEFFIKGTVRKDAARSK